MDTPNRYKGLRPNPAALGVTPLAVGEQSRPVRVRAETWVFDRLGSMTAAQVGQLIAAALSNSDTRPGQQPSSTATMPAPIKARRAASDTTKASKKGKPDPVALTKEEQRLLTALQTPGAIAEKGGKGEGWNVVKRQLGTRQNLHGAATGTELRKLVKLGHAERLPDGTYRALPVLLPDQS